MSSSRYQRGFSLPVAIFIIVIMALIGAAMVSIMQSGQRGMGRSVLSTRAFFAAQSGIQQTLASIYPLDNSAASCTSTYPTLNFSTNGLASCSAQVSCTSLLANGKTYYQIRGTGSCDLGGESATRQIEVMTRSP